MSDHLPATPGQTVGPFFGFSLPYDGGTELVPASRPGAVTLRGTVYDGAGDPVPDALLEVWQTDEQGRVPRAEGSLRRNQEFTGFGRAATDSDGHYSFTTVRPGGGFFSVTVFARGLLDRLYTRAYLPEHADAAFLATVPDDRRTTLVARADEEDLVFDLHLQGPHETVFLDLEGR